MDIGVWVITHASSTLALLCFFSPSITVTIVEVNLVKEIEMSEKQYDVLYHINLLSNRLAKENPVSDNYKILVARLNELLVAQAAVECMHEDVRKQNAGIIERIVTNGPLVSVIGTLLATGAVLGYEQVHVITSRAFSFIRTR